MLVYGRPWRRTFFSYLLCTAQHLAYGTRRFGNLRHAQLAFPGEGANVEILFRQEKVSVNGRRI